MKNKTKKMTKKVQIIHVVAEEMKRRTEGRDGGKKRSDILDSSGGNKKQQVRKKKNWVEGSEGRKRRQPSSLSDRCRDWLLNSAGAGVT